MLFTKSRKNWFFYQKRIDKMGHGAILIRGFSGGRRPPSITQRGEFQMKSTGIVRKVDELGRIVLPIELRRTLDIAERDSLEIYVDGSSVVLKKYQPACVFCDNAKDVISFKGRNVCPDCIKELLEQKA